MSEKDTLSLKESIVNRVGSALTRLVIRLKAFDVKKTEKISPGETLSHWLTLKTPGVRGKLFFFSFFFFFLIPSVRVRTCVCVQVLMGTVTLLALFTLELCESF